MPVGGRRPLNLPPGGGGGGGDVLSFCWLRRDWLNVEFAADGGGGGGSDLLGFCCWFK